MNSTESVIPTGNDEAITEGPKNHDLQAGCIMGRCSRGNAAAVDKPPAVALVMWNMRKRHFSHSCKTAAARMAVKGGRSLPVHRSEAQTLDGHRSGGYTRPRRARDASSAGQPRRSRLRRVFLGDASGHLAFALVRLRDVGVEGLHRHRLTRRGGMQQVDQQQPHRRDLLKLRAGFHAPPVALNLGQDQATDELALRLAALGPERLQLPKLALVQLRPDVMQPELRPLGNPRRNLLRIPSDHASDLHPRQIGACFPREPQAPYLLETHNSLARYPQGSPARPFEGWSIENSSGAKRRSGSGWEAKADHAFVPPATAALTAGFDGALAVSGARATDAQSRREALRFRSAKELLKVAVFQEDIGKCLLDNIDGGSVNKCGILIDPYCARIRQSNGRTNAAVLRAFKPLHTALHAQSGLVTLGLVPLAQDNRVSY